MSSPDEDIIGPVLKVIGALIVSAFIMAGAIGALAATVWKVLHG